MESLLFLAHRLPFPPNKGDKIRSFHFLQHLASRYRVFLGTFIDDPDDWRHVDALRGLCAEVLVEPLSPWIDRMRSAAAFVSGEAMTLHYFRNRRLQEWAATVAARERATRAFAFSSPMAQYALPLPGVRTFVDMVDMDSAKWDEYGRRRWWPLSRIYEREAARLLAYEREIASRAQASIFVTREEATLFCNASPEWAHRVVAIGNGVDSDYYSPSHSFASPYAADEEAIVFTGAMDYWPNVDAVVWFAGEVLPLIRKRRPSAKFYVVGMNPNATVRGLASDGGITVTGRVDDVRPFIAHASVVVAPLRVARGIQNKVLEAMAMAKPVVTTAATAAALSARQGVEIEAASTAALFAEKVEAAMDRRRASEMGALARARVLADYAWRVSFEALDRLLEEGDLASLSAGGSEPLTIPCTLAAS